MTHTVETVMANTSETNPSPEMDFASEFFNPQKVLHAKYVALPYPNARPYSNLADYYSRVFNKRKRPKNTISKWNDFHNGTGTQNASRHSDSHGCGYTINVKSEKGRFPCRAKKNKCKQSDVCVMRGIRTSAGTQERSSNVPVVKFKFPKC